MKGYRAIDPARPGMIGAICNLAKSAFDAHRVPEVEGFDECTTTMSTIKHLTQESLSNAMEGVLRIDIKNAQNLKDVEWVAGDRCDPYIVFKHGGSIVKSATIYGSINPVWNSTHYLCIRKRHLERKQDNVLTAVVFCRDAHDDSTSIGDAISSHAHLGVGSVCFDQCKEPGVHEFEIELTHPTMPRSKTPTVSFQVEFLSMEEALDALEKTAPSGAWMEPLTVAERSHMWCQLAAMTEVGDIELTQVAYIVSASKLTKAWIEVNRDLKMVVVSFSGTDSESLPRLLGDEFQPEPLKSSMLSQWEYVVKPRKPLRHAGVRVHGAFKTAYESIRESILRVVYDITEWSKAWTICLTGHSTGGALATICAFDFGNRRLKMTAESPKSVMEAAKDMMFHHVDDAIKPEVAMINFGAPRVGNGVFARMYDLNISRSLRVINPNDPVPHLPLHFVHTRTEVEFTIGGEVKISPKTIESREKSERARNALGITSSSPLASPIASPIASITPRGIEAHLDGSGVEEGGHHAYFETAQQIVKKCFWQDVESRGHPVRILRS